MVQGVNTSKVTKFPTNKKRIAGALKRKSTSLGPKKGGRVIAPKKRSLLQQQKITKKHSSGLTAMTERTLGARVGHLELLGHASSGKTKEETNGDIKGRKSKAKKSDQTVSSQGGSKKFG